VPLADSSWLFLRLYSLVTVWLLYFIRTIPGLWLSPWSTTAKEKARSV
jgi:hypothetical protein